MCLATLNDGTPDGRLMAPLPRAWQGLDGSVFPSHGELMDQALKQKAHKPDFPQMYQGVSDTVNMTAHLPNGSAPFGTLHQTVVAP